MAIGAAVVAAYLLTAALVHLSGARLRPLYDTIAPPPPYRWVRPPPLFAPGNVAPGSAHSRLPIAAGGSVATTVATPDGQCLVALPAGAVAAGSGSDVEVVLAPVDPATLGPLPGGLRPVGNACDVRVSLDGAAIRALVVAADVVVETPEPAEMLLFSTDGRTWSPASTQPVNGYSTLGSPVLRSPAYVVAGTSAVPAARHRGSTVVVAVAVALIALVLGGGPVLRSRVRRKARQDV